MFTFFSPGGTSFFPRFPPAPSPPRGVKGGLNTQFGFFALDRGVGAGGCGAGLLATMGKRCGRSKWIDDWRGCASSAPTSVCKVSAANEHTRASAAIGRAEQRSGGRIRAGACLSVASLRTTPGDVSSARHPVGARPLARLSFAYFSLAKQRKVSRPKGRNLPWQPRLFFGYFLLAKQKKVTRPSGRNWYSNLWPTGRNLYQEPHFRSKK